MSDTKKTNDSENTSKNTSPKKDEQKPWGILQWIKNYRPR